MLLVDTIWVCGCRFALAVCVVVVLSCFVLIVLVRLFLLVVYCYLSMSTCAICDTGVWLLVGFVLGCCFWLCGC